MTMISGGDQKVRSAFRAKLRDEPSRPSVTATETLSPDDILEVRDLASAIARAEQLIRSSPSSRPRDIFDALAEGDTSTPNLEALGDETDDCSGPALPAFDDPDSTTPPVVAASVTPVTPVTPAAAPNQASKASKASWQSERGAAKAQPLPVTVTQRLPVLYVNREEDAFYQPAGRIRSLADATLEAYRPEPTLLVRLRNRRKSLSWIVGAILIPLALLAGATLLRSRGSEASTRASTPTAEIAKPVESPKPVEIAKPVESPKPVEIAKPVVDLSRPLEKTSEKTAKPTATAPAAMPVLDVNSLPAAPARRR